MWHLTENGYLWRYVQNDVYTSTTDQYFYFGIVELSPPNSLNFVE